MSDVRRALEETEAIRGQVARATQFRGYGPATLAATGVLAIVAAITQAALVSDATRQPTVYLELWLDTAALSLTLIGLETIFRVRRVHSTLSLPMLRSAGAEFLPAIVAGLLLTIVIARDSANNLYVDSSRTISPVSARN